MADVINVGLVGYGLAGRVFHAPIIQSVPGLRLKKVVERHANESSKRYPEVEVVRDVAALLKDAEIDLVVITTPNTSHFEYAREALLAGKHVVVEKPFVATVKEGEELIALSKEKGKVLSVYQNRRYDSDYRSIKKVISEGWLGEIVEAEFHFDRYNKNLSPKQHKETPGPGTGAQGSRLPSVAERAASRVRLTEPTALRLPPM